MKRTRWLLAAGLAIAVVLLAVPAIVLAGRDSSPPARSEPNAEQVKQVRAPATKPLGHGKCRQRMEQFADWSV
jgi:hypothetical protein